MITMAEIIEKARLAGMDKFVDVDTVNRGWYVNLLSEEGKKVRMTQDELDAQAKFIADCMTEAEMGMTEEAPVPTMSNIMEDVAYEPSDLTQQNQIDLEDKYDMMTLHDEEFGAYEITSKLYAHIEAMKLAGKPVKTVLIKCEDCGRMRMVKVQDQHQVTRCVAHMREYRNAIRRAKRANKKK